MPVGAKSRESCRGCRGPNPAWDYAIGQFERSQRQGAVEQAPKQSLSQQDLRAQAEAQWQHLTVRRMR